MLWFVELIAVLSCLRTTFAVSFEEGDQARDCSIATFLLVAACIALGAWEHYKGGQ